MSSAFGPEYEVVRSLSEGGQAHTFVVKRTGDNSACEFVLKRLKNRNRIDRFQREISAVKQLSHPNILSIVAEGFDGKGQPFLVSEFCAGGNLKDADLTGKSAVEKFSLFYQVCDAVACAHDAKIYHRDIKPENVFLRSEGTPVLGDFGICFIEDDGALTMTEDVMGSRFYCAPELRDGRLDDRIPRQLADIYSLGKLLYWIFAHEVFDREETYGERHNQIAMRLSESDTHVRPVQAIMAASLVDDLVSDSVVANPALRKIQAAAQFKAKVAHAIDRVKSLGRPADLRLPKRCLFCGEGDYVPVHEMPGMAPNGPPFPDREKRRNPLAQGIRQNPPIYDGLLTAARAFTGDARGIPVYLVCNYCGNVQYFRFDRSRQNGEMWKP